MEEPKNVDKRSKEYRAWKEWKIKFDEQQAKKPKGIGDVVKSITKATGVDEFVKWVKGDDCGCNERKNILNNMFPFSKPNCLDEREYTWLTELFGKNKNSYDWAEIVRLYDVYNRVFSTQLKPTTCKSCVNKVNKKLKAIYDTYE